MVLCEKFFRQCFSLSIPLNNQLFRLTEFHFSFDTDLSPTP
jgi:hypothetical protein